MCENRFYHCAACGTVIGMIHDGGCPISCCGTEMERLLPNENTKDPKHTPLVRIHKKHATTEDCCKTPDTEPCCSDGICEQYCVDVGAEEHPMMDGHAIRWIYLQTNVGGHRKCLSPGGKPSVCFALTDEKPTAVYAYCDKHGLYMTEL